MKKAICIILTLIIAFSLFACAAPSESSHTSTNRPNSDSFEDTPSNVPPATNSSTEASFIPSVGLSTGIQKWEYKVLSQRDMDEFNRLGLEGWELIAAYTLNNNPQFFFKRPLP